MQPLAGGTLSFVVRRQVLFRRLAVVPAAAEITSGGSREEVMNIAAMRAGNDRALALIHTAEYRAADRISVHNCPLTRRYRSRT